MRVLEPCQAEAGLSLIGHAEACSDRLTMHAAASGRRGERGGVNQTKSEAASCAGQDPVLTSADGKQVLKGVFPSHQGKMQRDLRTGQSRVTAPLPGN